LSPAVDSVEVSRICPVRAFFSVIFLPLVHAQTPSVRLLDLGCCFVLPIFPVFVLSLQVGRLLEVAALVAAAAWVVVCQEVVPCEVPVCCSGLVYGLGVLDLLASLLELRPSGSPHGAYHFWAYVTYRDPVRHDSGCNDKEYGSSMS